ncbi:hypothetical protein [Hyphobacterium sp.]|uniref:hypothetical protein n=1 Tax=Hyphobacterium sp. TaxID=2004662 RepID=UPI003BAAEAFC
MKPLFVKYERNAGPAWSPNVRYLPTLPMGLVALAVGILALILATSSVARSVGLDSTFGVMVFLGTLLGGMAVLFAAMHALSVPAKQSDTDENNHA